MENSSQAKNKYLKMFSGNLKNILTNVNAVYKKLRKQKIF